MVASQTVQTVGDDKMEFTKNRWYADSSVSPVAVSERSTSFAVGPATNHSDFPAMQINQFLMTPYFGPGLLPHAQKLWIDELAVSTNRIGPLPVSKVSVGENALRK